MPEALAIIAVFVLVLDRLRLLNCALIVWGAAWLIGYWRG